jgi:acetyl-CoA carboxylase biotin carboxyl carrier protein
MRAKKTESKPTILGSPRVDRGSRIRGKDPSPAEPGTDPRIARLKEIVQILEGSSLAELKYEDQDIAIELSRHASTAAPAIAAPPPVVVSAPAVQPAAVSATPPPAAAAPVLAAAPAAAAAPKEDPDLHIVRSPFVGTFYMAPSPEAEAFTEVGKRVRRGQTLCIIEAMKLMNEIESEVDGTVVEIPPENGKAVQYGDALFKIRVSK